MLNKFVNKQRKSLIAYTALIIFLAMVIEVVIIAITNRSNAERTATVLINQVINILTENQRNEEELIDNLKEEYILRAKTIAYYLDSNPDSENDVEEMLKLSDFMKVDEICLFDADGVIYSGTNPKYYGFSFDSGEQISYFKPMLEDKTLTMCQDVTPNTAENKNMMYAITWNEKGTKMIQVGVEPIILLEELKSNAIPEVIANIPAYEGFNIYVANVGDGNILGSTDKNTIGKTLDEIGLHIKKYSVDDTVSKLAHIDGYMNYCEYKKSGDNVVVVTYTTKNSIDKLLVILGVELLYLLAAGHLIFYAFNKLIIVNAEKNEQLSILISMSKIYYSMHLVDLDKNSIKEYSSSGRLKELIDLSAGADVVMRHVMSVSTADEYRETMLQFTDINTIADRMKNKKLLSIEFEGINNIWFTASFITIEADDDGRPTKVMFVTRDIDEIKKKEEVLIAKSNTDELTGLLNRRAYEDDLLAYNDCPIEDDFVYIAFDLNGLKKVNDTLGHAAGDELIIGASICIKQCFGAYGKLYRIGGDEFVAIIFTSDKQLELIKKDFADITSKWSGKLVDNLTISSGYVTKRESKSASVREISLLADKRMYEDKRAYYQRSGIDRRR